MSKLKDNIREELKDGLLKLPIIKNEMFWLGPKEIIDFVLSPSTLELLKGLFEVDQKEAMQVIYDTDKAEIGDILKPLESEKVQVYYTKIARALDHPNVIKVISH